MEALIRLVAPGLNLVLGAGERLSRIVQPDDPAYYPARPGGAELRLPRSAEARPGSD